MTAVDQLHPLEVRVLRAAGPDAPFTAADLISGADLNLGQCNQAFSWLLAKGLIAERERVQALRYELTALGEQYRRDGLPEERIVALLRAEGPLPMAEIAGRLGLEQREVGSAYGALARERVLAMNGERRVSAGSGDSTRVATLRGLLERLGGSAAAARPAGAVPTPVAGPGASNAAVVTEGLAGAAVAAATPAARPGASNAAVAAARLGGGAALAAEELNAAERELAAALSRKRGAAKGLFRATETETVSYVLTAAGRELRQAAAAAGLSGAEVGALTPAMLADGSWRQVSFRRYNVNSPPGRVLVGRRNPYTAYLDGVRDQLTGLGFEEFDGPLVETNFWCCDALFMPQFHAARDEHDVYFIKEPQHASAVPEPYFERVAATHTDGWHTGSRGWGYQFDRDFARRTILRSQGTVVSAKTLTRARVPGKYFGIMRCFRPDEVDASHLADFYQTEGICVG